MGSPGQFKTKSALVTRVWGSEVARSSFIAGVLRATGMVVVFLLQLLLARLAINATHYGHYVWGQNLLFLLGTLLTLGLPVIASRSLAIHAHRGQSHSLRALIRRSHAWVGSIAVCGAILAALTLSGLPDQWLAQVPLSIIYLVLCAAPLLSLVLLRQDLARASSRLLSAFWPMQLARPLLTGFVALLTVVLTREFLSALDILMALSVSLLLVLLLQSRLGFMPRSEEYQAEQDKAEMAILAEPESALQDVPTGPAMLRQGLPVFAASLAGPLIHYGNTLFLGLVAGPVAAASFFVAERLAQIVGVPGAVASSVIQPWLASAHAEADHPRIQRVARHAAHVAMWPSLLLSLLFFVGGTWLLGLFGSDFRDALPVLWTLLAAQLVALLFGPNQQILLMSGEQRKVMRLVGSGAVVHLLALWWLLPAYGALGAAIASLCSHTVIAITAWLTVRRSLGIRPSVMGI